VHFSPQPQPIVSLSTLKIPSVPHEMLLTLSRKVYAPTGDRRHVAIRHDLPDAMVAAVSHDVAAQVL